MATSANCTARVRTLIMATISAMKMAVKYASLVSSSTTGLDKQKHSA